MNIDSTSGFTGSIVGVLPVYFALALTQLWLTCFLFFFLGERGPDAVAAPSHGHRRRAPRGIFVAAGRARP